MDIKLNEWTVTIGNDWKLHSVMGSEQKESAQKPNECLKFFTTSYLPFWSAISSKMKENDLAICLLCLFSSEKDPVEEYNRKFQSEFPFTEEKY